MSLQKRRILMKSFITSKLSNSLDVSGLLVKDNSFTTNQKSLQILAIEIFKVKMNIFPEIMNEIFDFSKNSVYELSCGKILSRSNIRSTHFGNESIRNIAAKIWNKIPNEIKEASSLTVFESKIKRWVPQVCPCRNSILCSYLVQFLSSCLKNRKRSPLKKFLYFCEMELSGSNIKKFLIFQETKTLKSFLYFSK